MIKLEELQQEAVGKGINLVKSELPVRIKAVYYAPEDLPPTIALSNDIITQAEETCVLAEELGHYYTSSGNLLSANTDRVSILKQENRARRWAARKIVPLESITQAFESGAQNRYEFAEYLGITESFFDWSISYYKKIHGLFMTVNNMYTIYFEPFGVFKNFE
ncbi:ImmA/IrrE family metallo-endopeptidase [Paradesulfitobacterium aromaticivorans]